MLYLSLFITFFEIGLFGFGGGYGMLSLILMILIARMFQKYVNTLPVQSVLKGLRPAVVGLLGAATLLLLTPDNFGSIATSPWQFWISSFLFAATFIGTYWMKINPIRMILYAAFAGMVLLY